MAWHTLKTLFVWLLMNVLVFTTCIRHKAARWWEKYFSKRSLVKKNACYEHWTSENIFMYILLLPYRFSNFSFATFPQFLWCFVEPRILESLAGCLTVLCPIDFYWIFLFHFGSLWCSRIVMNFPRFFMRYSSRWKPSCFDIPRTTIKFD